LPSFPGLAFLLTTIVPEMGFISTSPSVSGGGYFKMVTGTHKGEKSLRKAQTKIE